MSRRKRQRQAHTAALAELNRDAEMQAWQVPAANYRHSLQAKRHAVRSRGWYRLALVWFLVFLSGHDALEPLWLAGALSLLGVASAVYAVVMLVVDRAALTRWERHLLADYRRCRKVARP